MIGAVHAGVGAALGSLFKRRGSAFAAGVVSHLVADALPHKDFKPAIEVPLMAAAMAAIGKWRGVDSPEFWGAIGGITPDVEHAFLVAGVIDRRTGDLPHPRRGRQVPRGQRATSAGASF